ncbi:MAG: hypothetical protein RIC85_01440 [Gammaproteobacteria bacterium]
MMTLTSMSAGLSAAKDTWSLLTFLTDKVGISVISAYFRYDGTRVDGSEKIAIQLHPIEDEPSIWWYSVKPRKDYVFLREPVNPGSAVELVGTVQGEKQPDAHYWRWIGPTLPGRIWGDKEPPNLRMDFLVFGYRPKALIKHFSRK